MSQSRMSTALFAAPVAPNAGFVACPIAITTGWTPAHIAWMQQLYELARQRVQAEQEPSLWYRQVMMVSAN
jgi:hypothetical protein